MLLERVANENAELMAQGRVVRQHVNVESFEGKTSITSDAQVNLQVCYCLSLPFVTKPFCHHSLSKVMRTSVTNRSLIRSSEN